MGETDDEDPELPIRAQSKTGMLGSALEASAARDERNDERMFEMMRAQIATAEKGQALWFRLAMAELLVIVAIAVVILGRSFTVPSPTGDGPIEIGGGASAVPVYPAPKGE